jgi:hypothetical protein
LITAQSDLTSLQAAFIERDKQLVAKSLELSEHEISLSHAQQQLITLQTELDQKQRLQRDLNEQLGHRTLLLDSLAQRLQESEMEMVAVNQQAAESVRRCEALEKRLQESETKFVDSQRKWVSNDEQRVVALQEAIYISIITVIIIIIIIITCFMNSFISLIQYN